MSESSHPANGPRVIDKPDELLALHDTAEQLFETLRRWFAVPDIVEVDLAAVDSAVRELGDPQMIAALAYFNVDTRALPTAMRIYNQCMEIDAFAKAHPLKQAGAKPH